MHLKDQDWRRFWSKKATPQVPEWPSYGNFGKVAKTRIFWKSAKGDQRKFFEKSLKDALAEKAQKHTVASGIIL